MIRRSISAVLVALAGAAVLAIASCSRPNAIWTDNDGLLKYVPADTPYLFAALRPTPDELVDKVMPFAETIVDSYRTLMTTALDQAAADLGSPVSAEDQARMRAVGGVVAELITEEGRENAGIGRQSLGVIYGRGLLPVLRLGLSDGGKFEALISRIESAAGSELPVAKIGDHTYRYFENDAVRIAIAVEDDQLIVTAAPTGISDAHLTAVLEGELPSENIADSGKLRDLADEYEFAPFQIAFLDIDRFAATFLEPQSGVNAELLGLAGYDAATMLSDACRTEFGELANVVPRLVFGATKLDAERMDLKGVVELRSDIAAGLETVAAAVPGLGAMSDGFFSLGMGFDIPAARAFVMSRLDAIESEPYECEQLQGIEAGLPAMRQTLDTPLPPNVDDVHGFVAILDDVRGMNLAAGQPPTGVDARLLLASDSAPSLISMAAAFVSDIATLNLEPDGNPVRVTVPPTIGPMIGEAYAALTPKAVAVAVGNDAETRLRALLAVPAGEPIFLVSDVDMRRYYAMLADVMAFGAAQDPSMPPELGAAMSDIMARFADGPFGHARGEVGFTEHGIELLSSMTLND